MKSYEKIERIFDLMNDGSEKALSELKKIAKEDSCPLVRHEAVFAIGEMASKDSILFLKEVCRSDESLVVIHEALIAIGTLGNKEDIEFLEEFLKKEEYEIKESARIAIERIKDFSNYSKNVLENEGFYIKRLFLKEVCINEKIQILFQLMKIDNLESLQAIGKVLLEDSCPLVRHEAGFVLGEIGSLEAINFLKKSLEKEKNLVVIHEVLFALGTSGKKEALETIYGFLDSDIYEIRESARIARDRIYFLKKPYSGLKAFS